ncbi:hypothetical protein PAAG_12554 [Paracoccidioides lutzii Pb01]|uniref:Uncharacterized protein n=1 Tax=Paracoccidioides lutzii (strain ATCC MYA-826 / Pb01) TaxID=502779 RepID=A0A0A2V3R2_PARBA|nr:hypothetical protein PAAG_12554 [Paracoccidioides lutzii Pb01]KGQ00780.1 hypothetical protein PAAG_12554 [Paracoccidioides lutzii Pb01]
MGADFAAGNLVVDNHYENVRSATIRFGSGECNWCLRGLIQGGSSPMSVFRSLDTTLTPFTVSGEPETEIADHRRADT